MSVPTVWCDFINRLGAILIAGVYVIIQAVIDGDLDMGFKGKNSKTNVSRAIAYSFLDGIIFGCGIGFMNY